MEPQRNGWTMPSKRGRSSIMAKPAHFPKATKMPSAKKISEQRRQENMPHQEGDPPNDAAGEETPFEARLVIAGDHLVPEGLDMAVLDGITAKNSVWITRPEHNVFDLSSWTICNLREAVKELNWIIHDLRLSSTSFTNSLMIQKHFKDDNEVQISFDPDSRATVLDLGSAPSNADTDVVAMVGQLLPKMGRDIQSAAKELMALRQKLSMRVNFGRLVVPQKEMAIGDIFDYSRLSEVLEACNAEDQATLNVKLQDVRRAETAVKLLVDPAQGLSNLTDGVARRHSITMVMNYQGRRTEFIAGVIRGRALEPISRQPEARSRLNWRVAAPERNFDWNIEVNAWEEMEKIPGDIQCIFRNILVQIRFGVGASSFFPPVVITLPVGRKVSDEVEEVRVKTSAIVPFEEEPYVIEVSVTQTWTGSNTRAQPVITWGVELFGPHWDQALNQNSTDGRKKHWGEGLINIWPAREGNLEERLAKFLHCIIKVQDILQALDMSGGQANDLGNPLMQI